MTQDAEYDVVVAGAGMSGVVAAIAAARGGARVLLTDRLPFLGGNMTAGLLGNFLTFHNMKGEQITAGIAQEIVDHCIERGGAFREHRGHLPNAYGNAYSVTPVDPEVLKLVTQLLCVEAGVALLLNTYIAGTLTEGRRITGIRVVNKSGEQTMRAKVFVDATGDADLVAGAGGRFLMGDERGRVMSISLFSRLGNVNLDKHLAYVKENPDEFMLGEDPYIGKTKAEIAAGLKHWIDYPLVTGHYSAVKRAQARGEFHPNRQRVVFQVTTIPGVVVLNATSLLGYNPTDGESMTRAALEGREQIFKVADFFRRYVPGFEDSFILDSASALGVRESRRIAGVRTLTDADCVAGKKNDDDIALGAYCLDVHQGTGIIEHKHVRDGEAYGIPYGTLIPETVDGVIVAGRSLSSERFANGSARCQAPIMGMGQAAGMAAALCAEHGFQPRDVPVGQLRGMLRQAGAVV
ncbi:FAD-dependent oxidoreductase [Falsiroseomonas oryzae]|uniref:FAD-dependent oxidoreductase n=1 Tax=Falsiroseomonas oryzae TaxID=2766473 RepID=UPI0022EA51A2|nr:FAD-dependent oxidoreductase [Roseomonas sp. MO-31]